MRYKVIFNYTKRPNLVFNLNVLDHPGAHRFYQMFQRLTFRISHRNTLSRKPDIPKQQLILDQICNNINILETKYGVVCDFDILTNIQDIDQSWLNLAHRFFTTESMKINTANTFDLDLKNQHRLMQKSLHEINDLVHTLETYYSAVNNDFSDPRQIGYCSLSLPDIPMNQPTYTSQIHFTDYEKTFHSAPDEHHDLVLGTNILGKSVKESYWNDDDPNHWDTSGHHMSFGETLLLSDNYTKKIYTGEKFASWMHKYNTSFDKLRLDYPIADFSTAADKDRWQNYLAESNVSESNIAHFGEMIAK